MNADDLRKELKNKERSTKDLARYIKTRTDKNPNYSLLFGAGCSVSSGISSARDLINTWKQEIYENLNSHNQPYSDSTATEFFMKEHGNWYNNNNEYSSLFEKRYDLPRQRRIFVEKEVSNKNPSIGYAYLTKLVKHSYFNTIFTTNFDDLINEAFYQFSDDRPIVCAHDSAISSVTITSKRPKIIKLHGDYLFDDIKSTLRETESLEENIKNKFVEFAKDYGLIVVGYGGNDRSVMDILSYLLKHEDYYKNGIYWCIRADSYISEELRKLLWRDRSYYVVVDGFDEFFAELSHQIIGDTAPIETSIISNKSAQIISSFIGNKFLTNSKSTFINQDLEKLKKELDRNSILDLLNELNNDSGSEQLDNEYSDQELLCLLSLSDLEKRDSFSEVIKKCLEWLSGDIGKAAKIKIYKSLISAYKNIGDKAKAIDTCDDLISFDKNNPNHEIRKSKLINKYELKLNVLDKAISKDEFYYLPYYEKARTIRKYLIGKFGEERKELTSEALELLDLGIKRYPTISNPCWPLKFDIINKFEENELERKRVQKEIIDRLSEQDPFDDLVFDLRIDSLEKNTEKSVVDHLLSDIEKQSDKASDKRLLGYQLTYLDALRKFDRKDEIEDYMGSIELSPASAKNPDYLRNKISILMEDFGKLNEAAEIAEGLLSIRKNGLIIRRLAQCYLYLQNYDKALALLDKYKYYLDEIDCMDVKLKIYQDKMDLDKAAMVLEDMQRASSDKYDLANEEVYLLLLKKEYKKAQDLSKKFLDNINFDLHAEAMIVNYEFSIYKQKKKIQHKDRLNNLLKHTSSSLTKSAIYFLLGDKNSCYDNLREEIKHDMISKYYIRGWPIFEELRNEQEYKTLFNSNEATSNNVENNIVRMNEKTDIQQ